MAKVRVKHGTEGPAHDPYGWTEIHFTRTDGLEVTYRMGGLGYERCTARGITVQSFEGEPNHARMRFVRLTGMTPEKAEQVPGRLEYRWLRRQSPYDRRAYENMRRWEDRMLANAL